MTSQLQTTPDTKIFGRNPMRVRSIAKNRNFAVKGVTDTLRLPVTIAEGYEWIVDEDTICCEWFNGINLALEIEVPVNGHITPDSIISVGTRNNPNISPISNPAIFNALIEAWSKGAIQADILKMLPNSVDGKMTLYGVIIPMQSQPHSFYYKWQSRNHQISRMRFNQWHSGPKSILSMESWLFEDLHTKDNDFLDVEPNNRVDGIMFHNPKYQTWGRFRVEDTGYYRLGQLAKHYPNLSKELGQMIGERIQEGRKEVTE